MSLPSFLSRAAKSASVRLTRNVKMRAVDTRLDAPVVSFTFDDFPRSALQVGGRLLREAGWAGTYFAAGGLCGRTFEGLQQFTREDLIQARDEGHEVACHTFGHLRLPGCRRGEIQDDLKRNADFLWDALPAHAPSSFAYPYGDVNLSAKALIAGCFPIARGIWPGLNGGRMDAAQLKAVGLERRSMDRTDIDAWLDRAAARKAWLVFFTHDVCDDPSPYGYRRDDLARVIEKVAARGFRVLPLQDAARLAT